MLKAFLAGLVLAAVLVAAGWIAVRTYGSAGPLSADKAVIVPHASIEQVADTLAAEGVVSGTVPFRAAAELTRGQGTVKSGELLFPAHASLATVLAVLRAGKPVQHRLTIPEGLTAAQVAALLDKAQDLDGAASVPEEGAFLPETYAFERGTTRAALVERGSKAMARALDQAWAARAPDLPLATPREALILASIVERETARPEERPRIATVYLNRLRRGLKLQSDPTVAYSASGGSGVLDHGLTRAELDRDDPYNTYRVTGLPPGPIAMPGLAALRAVTQPTAGDELFFVADGGGGHVFSRTETEHLRNVAKWREVERARTPRP